MKLIVFDIDGTLLNSTGVDEECFQQALVDTFGIVSANFNWENFSDVTDQGVTEDILAKHLGRTATETEVLKVELKMGELVQRERATNPFKFTPAPGVHDVIFELMKSKDTMFCLATGAWKDSALAKLSALDVDLGGIPWAHAGPQRRRSDIVNEAVSRAKEYYQRADFSSIHALGDGKWDLLTAQELNLDFIGMDLLKTGRLVQLGAEKVIHEYSSLSDLKKLLSVT
ncbi:MAG: HAD family hydrolase [Flavobacteriales bacterium]